MALEIDFGVIFELNMNQTSTSKFDRLLDASWEGFGADLCTNHAIRDRKSEDWGSLGADRVRVQPSTQDPGLWIPKSGSRVLSSESWDRGLEGNRFWVMGWWVVGWWPLLF